MIHAAALASSRLDAATADITWRLRARSRAIGTLVFAGFGGLWAAGGALLSSVRPWTWFVIAALVLMFGLRAVRLLRAHPAVTGSLPTDIAARQRRAGRVFLWANAAEGVGILLAVNLVVDLGHPQWQTAAIMTVVGLHFLPLAIGFGYRPHLVTGVAMTAWALAYPALFAAGGLAAAGPFGAAAILFASAVWALRSVAAAR
jgi:hypothetical protein